MISWNRLLSEFYLIVQQGFLNNRFFLNIFLSKPYAPFVIAPIGGYCVRALILPGIAHPRAWFRGSNTDFPLKSKSSSKYHQVSSSTWPVSKVPFWVHNDLLCNFCYRLMKFRPYCQYVGSHLSNWFKSLLPFVFQLMFTR